MKRTLLVGGLSIAALFGAGVGVILALSRSPPTPATPDPPSPPPAPFTVAPAPPEAPVAAVPFRGGKLHVSVPGRDRPRGDDRRGETSPLMADRVTRKAVHKALLAASVRSRLAGCTGVGGFGRPSATGRVPRAAPASLLLELEARGGELRVVDAKVREWGGASEAMVSCARTVLRGQVIPAPRSRRSAGERMQMPFRLHPRGDTVASR